MSRKKNWGDPGIFINLWLRRSIFLRKFITNWTSGETIRIYQFHHNHFHVRIKSADSRYFLPAIFLPSLELTRNFEGLPRIETQKILMDIPSEAVAHCTLLSNQYHDMAVLSVHEKPTKHTRKRCPIFCLAILILRQFPFEGFNAII